MKKKRSDLITEGIKEKIQHDSWDRNEEFKLNRSKWIRWLLNIIDNIVTALT
jgi:metal-responsive CopG/Arc/MetJ family transcriptional regulator